MNRLSPILCLFLVACGGASFSAATADMADAMTDAMTDTFTDALVVDVPAESSPADAQTSDVLAESSPVDAPVVDTTPPPDASPDDESDAPPECPVITGYRPCPMPGSNTPACTCQPTCTCEPVYGEGPGQWYCGFLSPNGYAPCPQ